MTRDSGRSPCTTSSTTVTPASSESLLASEVKGPRSPRFVLNWTSHTCPFTLYSGRRCPLLPRYLPGSAESPAAPMGSWPAVKASTENPWTDVDTVTVSPLASSNPLATPQRCSSVAFASSKGTSVRSTESPLK